MPSVRPLTPAEAIRPLVWDIDPVLQSINLVLLVPWTREQRKSGKLYCTDLAIPELREVAVRYRMKGWEVTEIFDGEDRALRFLPAETQALPPTLEDLLALARQVVELGGVWRHTVVDRDEENSRFVVAIQRALRLADGLLACEGSRT